MRKDEAQTTRRSRGQASEVDAAGVMQSDAAGRALGASASTTDVPGTGRAPRAAGLRTTVLRDLLTELTLRERLVLGLRYVDDLTVAEIAAVLEVAATEVERILDSVSERVRRRLMPTYGRPAPRLA